MYNACLGIVKYNVFRRLWHPAVACGDSLTCLYHMLQLDGMASLRILQIRLAELPHSHNKNKSLPL